MSVPHEKASKPDSFPYLLLTGNYFLTSESHIKIRKQLQVKQI